MGGARRILLTGANQLFERELAHRLQQAKSWLAGRIIAALDETARDQDRQGIEHRLGDGLRMSRNRDARDRRLPRPQQA